MDNKALGKGLSALIPRKENPPIQSVAGDISSLEIKLIRYNPVQPRKDYNEAQLEELKASIKEKGVLQPILVRPAGQGYEVIAGERRLRAATSLGLTKIPAVVKTVTDREALVLALVENIQRQDLNAIEEAQGYKRLIEEFEFTPETVAQSVGKDRSTINNLIRLLKLPREIQEFVIADQISMGHARALLALEEPKLQIKTAQEIISKQLSVRQVESYVKELLQPKMGKQKIAQPRDRDIEILQEELARTLGTKVKVENKNNKGRLIIEYYSLSDFDRILGILRK
jgi:ParB family transcriptional regulator, chromosome partitioning protein